MRGQNLVASYLAADGTSRHEIAPCLFQPSRSNQVLGTPTTSAGSSSGGPRTTKAVLPCSFQPGNIAPLEYASTSQRRVTSPRSSACFRQLLMTYDSAR